jgi:hypothetical protein
LLGIGSAGGADEEDEPDSGARAEADDGVGGSGIALLPMLEPLRPEPLVLEPLTPGLLIPEPPMLEPLVPVAKLLGMDERVGDDSDRVDGGMLSSSDAFAEGGGNGVPGSGLVMLSVRVGMVRELSLLQPSGRPTDVPVTVGIADVVPGIAEVDVMDEVDGASGDVAEVTGATLTGTPVAVVNGLEAVLPVWVPPGVVIPAPVTGLVDVVVPGVEVELFFQGKVAPGLNREPLS